METLAPTTTVFSCVKRADVAEVAQIVSPQYACSANLLWIREAYAHLFGAYEVDYTVSDSGYTWYSSAPAESVESAFQLYGAPDIITWGVWLALRNAMCDAKPVVPFSEEPMALTIPAASAA